MKQVPGRHRSEASGPFDAISGASGDSIVVRAAEIADLPELLAIESRCFESDRVSARSFRHLLRRAHAINLVAGIDAEIAGYVTVLLRRGSRLARAYSLAVDPRFQGRGIGSRLLEAAEARAIAAGCRHMRLEVRVTNCRALRQYVKGGYAQIGVKPEYYEDGEAALHLQKRLVSSAAGEAC